MTPEVADLAIDMLRANLTRIMRNVGEKGNCRICKREVRYMRHHASGRIVPYDEDGTPHMARCCDPSRLKVLERQQSLL